MSEQVGGESRATEAIERRSRMEMRGRIGTMPTSSRVTDFVTAGSIERSCSFRSGIAKSTLVGRDKFMSLPN
jgi:hypothetical protein